MLNNYIHTIFKTITLRVNKTFKKSHKCIKYLKQSP